MLNLRRNARLKRNEYMELKNTKTREKLLAVITIAMLVVIFLFSSIIDPQLKERKKLLERYDRLFLEMTKTQANVLIRDRIEKVYSEVEPFIASHGNQQQQISKFTNVLDQMYSKLNVQIRSVKILPVSEENSCRRLTIRIEMTGSVTEFLKFVQAVEKHPEPIKIEQFELTAQELKDTVRVSMLVSRIVTQGMAGKRV